MGISQLGTSAPRLVTKQNAAGHTALPTNLAGVAVSTSSANRTYGSWVQVTASTSAEYYLAAVAARGDNDGAISVDGPLFLQVGIGGSGSEFTIAEVVLEAAEGQYNSTSPNFVLGGHKDLSIPPRIASGTAVSVRVAAYTNSSFGALPCHAWLTVVPYANVEGN